MGQARTSPRRGGSPLPDPPRPGPGLPVTRLALPRLRGGPGADFPGQALQVGVLGEQGSHGWRRGRAHSRSRSGTAGPGRSDRGPDCRPPRNSHPVPSPRDPKQPGRSGGGALAGSTTCAGAASGVPSRQRAALDSLCLAPQPRPAGRSAELCRPRAGRGPWAWPGSRGKTAVRTQVELVVAVPRSGPCALGTVPGTRESPVSRTPEIARCLGARAPRGSWRGRPGSGRLRFSQRRTGP